MPSALVIINLAAPFRVVFGTGKRYFGALSQQVLLEDPDEVVRGDRVLHLRFRVKT